MSVSITKPSGWYAFKTDQGEVGIVKHGSGAFNLGNGQAVTSATYLGTASQTMGQLLSSSGPKVQTALVTLGATPKQTLEFIGQVEGGAPTNPRLGGGVGGAILNAFGVDPIVDGSNPTQLNLPTSGNPTASAGTNPVPTTLKGSADAGPSVTGSLNLGGVAIRVLEAVGAVLLLVFALRAFQSGGPIEIARAAKAASPIRL